MSVAGQILDRGQNALRVYANSSVTVLRQMEELARTATNELGEFQLEFPPDDNLMLTVNLEGEAMLVSALPGAEPPSARIIMRLNHRSVYGIFSRLELPVPDDVHLLCCGCGTGRRSHSTDCASPGRCAGATGGMHPARLQRSISGWATIRARSSW